MYRSLLLIALVALPLAHSACPNLCSGHGTCGANDQCTCQQDWQGGDCSKRTCPFSLAWVDTATAANTAHQYAECGNRGTCDRETGQCVCETNFGGKGCRRQICPESCSGHGTCEFIEEFAKDTDDKRYGVSTATTYTLWDQEKMMGCKCDPGWEGHKCHLRTCPRGDDPLTTGQNDMIQYIKVGANGVGTGGSFSVTYYDLYGGKWTTEKIAFNTADATTCASIQTALRKLPNYVLHDVKVTYSATINTFARTAGVDVVTNGGGTGTAAAADGDFVQCLVEFQSSPGTTGKQHLLTCSVAAGADGSQPKPVGVAGASCTVAEHHTATGSQTRKLTESSVCSGRGTCDSATGLCTCFAGHKGLACEQQDALV